MTLGALLAVGAAASAGSAWALGRGGATARAGALAGLVGLLAMGALAAVSPTPVSLEPDRTGAVPGTLWNGALVPGAYLRLAIALWCASSLAVMGLVWLLRGTPGLRGLLPATLGAATGGTVALAAADPGLGALAAGAAGLAAVPVVLAGPRRDAGAAAAREIALAVGSAAVVATVAAAVPALARLVLANPAGPGPGPASGEVAALTLGMLAVAVMVAVRTGVIPWHVRVSALADLAPTGGLPLLVAWLPLPLAAVAIGVAPGRIAPLMPSAGPAQALVVAVMLAATLGAALAAVSQDDLRHAAGYLAIGDLGLAVLGAAALDPAAWGPVRAWLLMTAVTRTALFGWAAVVEDRFATRSVPELRGWARRSPILLAGLILVVAATYGLPGWAALTTRLDLTAGVADGPWATLLLVASLTGLLAYLRWLRLGVGTPTSHVERAAAELGAGRGHRLGLGPLAPARLGRREALPVAQEGAGQGGTGAVTAPDPDPGRRGGAPRPGALTEAARALLRSRAGLLSGVVLAMAVLASLVAWGALDTRGAACERTPAMADAGALCR